MAQDVVTTVLAPAATYDLTDLATVRDELGITAADTSNDTWLARAISQVSRAVMNDTNRVFAPETLQDVFDISRGRSRAPTGAASLQLSRWPVLAMTSVIQTLQDGATTVALAAGTDYRVDAENGRLVRLDATTGREINWEPVVTTVIYAAGFGAATSEQHTVPATPYKVTVTASATFACDRLVAYANGTALARVTGAPTTGQYSAVAGVYTFAAGDTGQALSFSYCTGAIPDDLVDAALRLVTARYRAKGRDPAMVQRETPGLGTERFWFGSVPGQKGPFPPDIEAILDNYHVPVAA